MPDLPQAHALYCDSMHVLVGHVDVPVMFLGD